MLRNVLKRIRPTQPTDGRPTKLVVGLGNPGAKYKDTRHNVGFMTIDRLARKLPQGSESRRFDAVIAEIIHDETRIILAKPLTYMNNSGQALVQIMRWYKVTNDRILVIYDDLDIAFGRLKLLPAGGSGGHNGIESVIQSLDSKDFPRLRVGIGRPIHGTTLNYVLSRFSDAQAESVPKIVDASSDAALMWIESGIDIAMNAYNRQDVLKKDGRVGEGTLST